MPPATTSPTITVDNLSKQFKVPVREDVLARIVSAAPGTEVVTTNKSSISVRVPGDDGPRGATLALDALEVLDLSFEDPPIEDIIEQVFNAPGEAADR